MSCQDVRERLTDALLGEAPPDVREELLEHAAGCAGCADAAEELRQTLELLRGSSWPAETVLGDAERRRLFERARARPLPIRWIAAAAVLVAAAVGGAMTLPALQLARHQTGPIAPAAVAEAEAAPAPAAPSPTASLPTRVRPSPAVGPPPPAERSAPEPAPAVEQAHAPAVVARQPVGPFASPIVPATRPRRFPEELDPVARRDVDDRQPGREAQTAVLLEPAGDGWIPAHGRTSRFGFDVGSASLALVREALLDGRLPEPSAVRVEEFVNAVPNGQPPPAGVAFAVDLEAARTPFDGDRAFLRVGIRAREVSREDRPPVHLVFVVDLSESMGTQGRLDLLKRNLRRLAERLDGGDSVGIVAHGAAARVVLAPTPGDARDVILEAIAGLETEGSADAVEALQVGYELAAGAFEFGAVNRVVLCTDGLDAPLGDAGLIRRRASAGIQLAVLGLGTRGDDALQRLAREGHGPYASVAGAADARRFLLRDLSHLEGIVARAARVEVEFDPARVRAYRRLGDPAPLSAPSRGLRSDASDASDVYAGQTVTALYELRLSPGEGPLGTVRVRFEQPDTGAAEEVSRAIRGVAPERAFDDASAGFQLTVLAGRFAQHLRRERPDESFRLLFETAQRARPRVSSLDRETEFLPMIRAAGRLLGVRE